LDLGVDYKGTLGEAKSTINRFLRNDCRQLGVVGMLMIMNYLLLSVLIK
jgi:hypothetical protein